MNEKPLKFTYKNYKDIVSVRSVMPQDVFYGTTKWHKEKQWLLVAFDLDKDSLRTFAMTNIISWVNAEPIVKDEHSDEYKSIVDSISEGAHKEMLGNIFKKEE